MSMEESPNIRAGSPLYLVTAKYQCHICMDEVEVVSLAAAYVWNEEEPEDPEDIGEIAGYMISAIEVMPSEIFAEVRRIHPRYGIHWSDVFEKKCYANHCTCGAWFEDFDLHNEPGIAFFPMHPGQTKDMTVRTLPFEGYFDFKCRYAWGSGLYTFVWARKIP